MRGTSGYNKFESVRVQVAMVTNPGLEGGGCLWEGFSVLCVGHRPPLLLSLGTSLSLNFNGNSDQMKDMASKRMEMEVREGERVRRSVGRQGGGKGEAGRSVTDRQKHSASFSLGEMKESTSPSLPPLPPLPPQR